ncbi:MAG: hypothetical protein ACOVP4_13375 [Bacteriovoracaceae bacterium]
MNFKLIFLFIFLCTACGVKGNPVHPDGTEMPSIPSQYKQLKVTQPLNEAETP